MTDVRDTVGLAMAQEFDTQDSNLVVSHRGWVPTVLGRLFFDFFGHTSFPEKAETVNVIRGGGREIIVFQKRQVRDAAWPLVAQWLSPNRETYLWFACVASTSVSPAGSKEMEVLEGELFIILPEHFKEYRNNIIEAQGRLKEDKGQGNEIGTGIRKDIRNKLRECGIFYARFFLKANGVIEFFQDKAPIKASVSVEFPDCTEEQRDDRLMSQLFYFIKDLCHKHKHHAEDSDTINALYRVRPETDYQTWRRQVYDGLTKHAVNIKRDEQEFAQISALGILAYAKTFWQVSAPEPTHDTSGIGYCVCNLEDSVRTRHQQDSLEAEWRKMRADDFHGTMMFILATIGFILAANGLQSAHSVPSGLHDSVIVKIAAWMNTFIPHEAAVVCLWLWYRWEKWNSSRRGIERAAVRLIQSFPQRVSGMLLMGLGSAVIIIFVLGGLMTQLAGDLIGDIWNSLMMLVYEATEMSGLWFLTKK